MKQFGNLLKPGKMGRWELPNRIVMAPMGSLNADGEGYVTDNTIAFYQDMAKGGDGLIIVECTYTDELLSKGEENCMGLTRDDQIVGMRRLATAIHDKGPRCVLQLCHIGHQLSLAGKKESLGPSDMVEMMGPFPFPIRGATREEIAQIIKDFADCSYRAKMAGFDGVEIHGAIGHLINMFCTPFYNRRTDEYGGSPENRIRFMKEIIEAIQARCGRDFPIIGRICGCDFDPDGITLEEGILHAKILETTGIIALHVVGGSNRNVMTINCQYDERGAYLDIVKAMKEAGIRTPIIVDGGLSTPDLAEKVITEGYADFVGIGRPKLADPDWVVKLKEDRPEDIRPCIRCCMGCVGTVEQFANAVGLRCSVNPTCNLTRYRQLAPPAKNIKKVCVIGGGPGGMEAALVATQRGHQVTLYEKRKLGGMVHEAAFDLNIKGDLTHLLDYYKVQIEKHKIDVRYQEATPEMLTNGAYDVIIDATGSVPVPVREESSRQVKVHSIYEFAQNSDMPLGENVVIVGGCFPNAEMAYSLAKKGKKVTISTRRLSPMQVGDDNSSPMMQRLAILSAMAGVQTKAASKFCGVNEEGAIVEDVNTKERSVIPCDDVIVCHGFTGSSKLYNAIRDAAPEVYRVGDCQMGSRCVSHTTIGNAIEQGWVVANRI